VFTHCGSQIVAGDGRSLGAAVWNLGRERGVKARIACDGLELKLGEPRGSSLPGTAADKRLDRPAVRPIGLLGGPADRQQRHRPKRGRRGERRRNRGLVESPDPA